MSSSTEPSPNSKPFNLLLPVQVPMVDSIEGSEEASAWWAVQRVVFQLFSIGVKQFLSECQNRQRKGSFQKSWADWRPAIRSQDLHWQALCSSKSSSPSRSPAQAVANKCDWRKVPNGFYLGWLHLAPPYVRFCSMSCWHFDLTFTLWAGQPDVVLGAKSVWDLKDSLRWSGLFKPTPVSGL